MLTRKRENATIIADAEPEILEGTSIDAHQRASFFRNLASYLNSGMSLQKALAESKDDTGSVDFESLSLEIAAGKSLSETLREKGSSFSELEVELVRLGEASGELDKFLVLIRRILEEKSDSRADLRWISLFLIVLIHLVLILPALPIFDGVARSSWADIVRDVVILDFVLIGIGIIVSKASLSGWLGILIDKILLSIPFIGKDRRLAQLHLFADCFLRLIQSGLPISRAATLASAALESATLKREVASWEDRLAGGESLSKVAKKTFPPPMIPLLVAGEQTGTVDDSLRDCVENLKRLQERANAQTSKIFSTLLPFLGIVLLGSYYLFLAAPQPPQAMSKASEVFRAIGDQDGALVSFGESIPLLSLSPTSNLSPLERANTIVQRLNESYGADCQICGQYKLMPRDLRVGRFRAEDAEHDDIVVFYSHIDDGRVIVPPTLLATVTEQQSNEKEIPRSALAHYWRDLIRDVLAFSMGQATTYSPFGKELRTKLVSIRHNMTGDSSIENLEMLLSELSSQEQFRLRKAFQDVPADFREQEDSYESLKFSGGTLRSLSANPVLEQQQ